MKELIFFIYFIVSLLSSVKAINYCQDPQKSAYLSFNFLSKRDTISNLFNQTNYEMNNYDFVYNDPQSNKLYNLSSMHPQFYYNQHFQIDQFMSMQKSKVRLGKIEYAFNFNYQIIQNGISINKGWANGRKQADDTYFIKDLILNDDSLQWQLSQIRPIKVSQFVPIDFFSGNISDTDKIIFQQMVNDQVGQRGLKQKILSLYNAYYAQNLKKHLNSEHLFNNTKFTYTYKNLTLQFNHLARDPQLVNNPGGTQGLICHFTLQISGREQNCSHLPSDFSIEQGGAQELIGMQTLKQSFKAAIQHGIFDISLDSKWDVKTFQFFMGDLSNVVKNGIKYLPSQPIYGKGKFNRNKAFNIVFGSKSNTQIQVKFPYTVTLTSQSQQLLKVDFIMSASAKLVALNDALLVQTNSVISTFQQYTAFNPDFQVTNIFLAKQYMNNILAGLKDIKTFGTGWPLIYRRFPSLIVQSEQILINDYSQL